MICLLNCHVTHSDILHVSRVRMTDELLLPFTHDCDSATDLLLEAICLSKVVRHVNVNFNVTNSM